MGITNLEKSAIYRTGEVKLLVEITLNKEELLKGDYTGFDMFPDSGIMDVLIEAGERYKEVMEARGVKLQEVLSDGKI